MEKTRFVENGDRLCYEKLEPGLWRFFIVENGNVKDASVIGPYYATKTELLSDLNRYADFYGFGK